MNLRKFLLAAICAAITLAPVAAQETNYIKLNKNTRWEKTSNRRLALVILNPVRYKPEEFYAALHEYSKRRGLYKKPKNTLQALVNAYIAFNPEYKNQSAEEIFIWTGRSRGVPSLQNSVSQTPSPPSEPEDTVSLILAQLGKNFKPPELASEGINNGAAYTVYQINDSIKITVSADADGTKYMIGNVNSAETMQKAVNLLTKTFTKPIPYLNTGEFKATFYDEENVYIHDDMPDYAGTFTVLGSQLFVEEVTVEDKTIVQRQWCMPDFYDACAAELGKGWGFVASWDNNQ